MTKTYKITGMKCQGCVNTVTEKLSAVKGVDKVQVDLENKQVIIDRYGFCHIHSFYMERSADKINPNQRIACSVTPNVWPCAVL